MDKEGYKIRAVIVDDEPGCVANLRHYLLKYCPGIEIVATGSTVSDVLKIIEEVSFDVAFFDIEIFDTSIFSIITDPESLHFSIVFVTAYERYAVKAFKVNALDYVLKPLSEEDILRCWYKIKKRFLSKEHTLAGPAMPKQDADPKKVILRQGEHVYIVRLDDIYYLKAQGFYTQVVFGLKGKPVSVVVSKPISTLEKEYNDEAFFFRIHKSYLINTRKVSDIVRNNIVSVRLSNDELIPIAKRRVSSFLTFLNEAV